MLFKVNVYRMHPATGVVLQNPHLRGVSCHSEAIYITIGELSVYLPLSIASFEPECACYRKMAQVHRREVVKLDDSRRVLTVVGYGGQYHVKSQDKLPSASREDISRGSTSVVLLQSVLQEDRLSMLEFREIDN